MRSRPLPFLLVVVVASLDCAPLTKLVDDACGNGVIDPREDCDTFPVGQCGEPGTAAQCRLRCSSKDNLFCPKGWGCSVEGFCREPIGTFADARESVSAGVTTLLVGDFDADGRKDIFGSSAFGSTPGKGRFHYFDDDGALSAVVPLAAVTTSPLVYDFDGDTRDDLAFGFNYRLASEFAGGIALVLGQTDRAIAPKLFPTFTRDKFDAEMIGLAVADPLAEVPAGSDPVLALAFDASGEVTLLSLDADLTNDKGFRRVVPGTGANVSRTALAGKIFATGQTSACGEVAVAVNDGGGGHVFVYSPCIKGPGGNVTWDRKQDRYVKVDVPERITGLHGANVDGDAYLDVLVGSESGRVYVSRSDGSTLLTPIVDPRIVALPLASADLNGDGKVDFVTGVGVFYSLTGAGGGDGGAGEGGSPSLGYGYIPVPAKKWTIAKIADVNRDGLLDVIGASSEAPDIDVLEGTSHANVGLMPSFTITTSGTVSDLAVGDFDLDGTFDVAFVQTRSSPTDTELAVAYGRPFSMPPEAYRSAGRIPAIKQLYPTQFGMVLTTSTPGKNVGDLPSLSYATLLASGERQPIAPLLFLDERSLRPAPSTQAPPEWSARALVAGRTRKGGGVDLVSLAGTSAVGRGGLFQRALFGMWTAEGTGPASFAAPEERMPIADLEREGQDAVLYVQSALGDLDGDGIAELVAVTPFDQTGTAAIRVTTIPSGKGPTPGSAAGSGAKVSNLYVTKYGRIELVDVDSDGRLDLIAVLGDDRQSLGVHVFFGNGTGSFAVPGVPVVLPAPYTGEPTFAFALVTTGGEPRFQRELAVITSTHLFRARLAADKRSFAVVDETSGFKPSGLTSATGLAAGDFDGDGVEDLAVADSGSIRVLPQRARLPRSNR